MKYYVVSWNTNEVLAEYDDLAKAKKDCRARGYNVILGGKLPVAFVAIKDTTLSQFALVYNPRFNTLRGE